MADNLRWLNFTGFPGVNTTLSDHYLQPRKAEGPALMRRLLSIDPFTEPGRFTPAKTFSEYLAVDADQGLGHRIHGGALLLYRVEDGVLYERAGATWSAATADATFEFGSERVRMAEGFNALFLVDGTHRPRVFDWPHDHTLYPMLAYSSDDKMADIKYTRGSKTTPDNSQDDFIAEHVCIHMECLVLAAGSEVRMSPPYNPLKFWADPAQDPNVSNRWFWVQSSDGTSITGMHSFQGKMLVVTKRTSLHGYTGTDPASNYSHTVIDDATGLVAAESLASGREALWGCGIRGPWMFDLTNGVSMIGGAIQKDWDSLSIEEMEQVVGWFDGRYHIILPKAYLDTSGTIPENAMMRLTYDPDSKCWAQGWGIVGIKDYIEPVTGTPYCLTAAEAHIWKQNDGTQLAGEDVVNEVILPMLEFGNLHRDKWVRRVRVELEQGPETVEFAYRLDSSPVWTAVTIPAARAQAVYAAEGTAGHPHYARYDDPAVVYYGEGGHFTLDFPVTAHAKTAQFRLRGVGLQVLSVGIGYEYEVI